MLVVRGVCTALREVPHLVPAFMDVLLGLLPLQRGAEKPSRAQLSAATDAPAAAAAKQGG